MQLDPDPNPFYYFVLAAFLGIVSGTSFMGTVQILVHVTSFHFFQYTLRRYFATWFNLIQSWTSHVFTQNTKRLKPLLGPRMKTHYPYRGRSYNRKRKRYTPHYFLRKKEANRNKETIRHTPRQPKDTDSNQPKQTDSSLQLCK
jgi:hypothetical protein